MLRQEPETFSRLTCPNRSEACWSYLELHGLRVSWCFRVQNFYHLVLWGSMGMVDCLGQAQISSDEREAEDLRVPWLFHGIARWTKFGRIGKAIDTFEYKLFTLTGPGHSSFSTPSSTAKRMISRFTSAFTSICLHLSHTIIIYYPLKHEDNTEFRGTPWDTCPPVKVRFGGSCPSTRSACTAKGAAGATRGHQGSPGVIAAVPRHGTSQRITAQVEGGGQRAVQVARQQWKTSRDRVILHFDAFSTHVVSPFFFAWSFCIHVKSKANGDVCVLKRHCHLMSFGWAFYVRHSWFACPSTWQDESGFSGRARGWMPSKNMRRPDILFLSLLCLHWSWRIDKIGWKQKRWWENPKAATLVHYCYSPVPQYGEWQLFTLNHFELNSNLSVLGNPFLIQTKGSPGYLCKYLLESNDWPICFPLILNLRYS